MLNREELREIFYYNEGILYWRVTRTNSIKVGDIAGHVDSKSGYYRVSINYKNFTLHRVIWNYFNNTCEGYVVDHIDGDILNNKIENLRLATAANNSHNSVGKKNSLVPYKGVSLRKKRFCARITYEGKKIHLGTYATAEEASEVYQAKAKELHGEYYRKA